MPNVSKKFVKAPTPTWSEFGKLGLSFDDTSIRLHPATKTAVRALRAASKPVIGFMRASLPQGHLTQFHIERLAGLRKKSNCSRKRATGAVAKQYELCCETGGIGEMWEEQFWSRRIIFRDRRGCCDQKISAFIRAAAQTDDRNRRGTCDSQQSLNR